MSHTHRIGSNHAIVIGGSIVGSVIAAMLAERFERVTILERDRLPDGPESRAGVPQARHVHALLARGAAELERLFPGFKKGLVDRGAQLIDVGRDVAWLTPAGWGARFESDITLCCATRDLIEAEVRRRTLLLPNVALLDGVSVQGLFTIAQRSIVTGVRIRDRRNAAEPLRALYGSLVVDASGRGSQLPEWLAETGRLHVREELIDAGMTYASRFYGLPPDALRGWRAAYVQAALPDSPRGGILFPVEHDRWHLTLFGYANSAPPSDEQGFRAFVDGLRSPILADVLRHATPLTQIVSHRRTANRWRRFDEVPDWPDGLIAAGDSVCCFDPVYGQGMTTGILGALEMKALLDSEWDGVSAPRRGFTRRVQRQIARSVRPAWNLATSEDLRLATTTGGKLGTRDRLLQRYFDTVVATATADPAVRRRLLSVMNMLTGPETLMHPQVVSGVVRHVCGWNPSREAAWPERETAQLPVISYQSSLITHH